VRKGARKGRRGKKSISAPRKLSNGTLTFGIESSEGELERGAEGEKEGDAAPI